MRFKVLRRPSHARITLADTFENHHIDAVRDSASLLIDQGFTNLIMDFSQARDDYPLAIRATFASIVATCLLKNGVVVFVAPGASIREFLTITRFHGAVDVVSSREEALCRLLARIPKRYDKAFFTRAIESGALSEDGARAVIRSYRQSGESIPLGTILVDEGHMPLETLIDIMVLTSQTSDAPVEDFDPLTWGDTTPEFPLPEPPPAPQTVRPGALDADESADEGAHSSEFITPSLMGEILVERGFITPSQLKEALEIQRSREGSRLGDVLIERGFIATDEVFEALHSQCRRRDGPDQQEMPESEQAAPINRPASEFVRPSLLGEILLELNLVTEAQLRNALEVQRQDVGDRQLGNILVQMGAVTAEQILAALEEQTHRKD